MKPETKQELRDQVAHQENLLDIQQQAIGDLEDKLYPQKIYLDHADIGIALNQQKGRLRKLANKIKDQSPRDYKFDVDMQAVVPTESNE